MVVDDEPSIVDAVATALRYEGYEVDEAATGRDALEAVVRQEPGLVVLDWMLPDTEGGEGGRGLRGGGFRGCGGPRGGPCPATSRASPPSSSTSAVMRSFVRTRRSS